MTALTSPIFDSSTSGQAIVFIEDNLADWQTLAQALGAKAKVVVLDSQKDGLQQMAEYLAGLPQGSVDAIHLLSHGSSSALDLGLITLNSNNLRKYSEVLAQMGAALNKDGDFLIYGCAVAQRDEGKQFIDALAVATGADVSASDNLTGASWLGGDWVLETHSGTVNSAALMLDAYTGTLALNFTNDFVTGLDAPQDLVTDSQSNLYITSNSNHTLYKLAASGGVITGGAASTIFATVTNANCVAIDAAGNLYLGTGNGIIRKYPASGGVPSSVGGTSLASGFNNISDIVVGSDGYLYVADSGAGAVYKLPASGGPFIPTSAPVSASVSAAQQLYIDAANNLYVTSQDLSLIHI